MSGKILVTPRSLTAHPHPAFAHFEAQGFEIVLGPAGKQPDEAALLSLIPDCIGWIAGVEPVSEAVIAAAGSLRAVARNGVGTDNLPVAHLRARGIPVLTADGANAAGVAELALTLILSALRHVPAADAGIKAGHWPRRRGRELRAATVGVIGCGAIGRDVAKLTGALGARVIGYDPMRPNFESPHDFRWAEIPALLADSDIVTLHCPPPADGRPLIDAEHLAIMRHGAILVNTARAGLVDEAAVLAAIESGQLDTYAADVFAEEPPRSLALAGHPHVIATSHIGAFTEESVDRATVIAVQNLLAALQGDHARPV
ncbi:phosphoglycerate dehydrogenase [Acidisoma silvae]|uniref:Phosphoglycerate dehydrogenase n=1 Tax=Acidisoma silvae TaxID=2802396 RepID=A0A964DZQ1_9PROT|nr:phosphoglycerate dehydrogenase [Acidisoma silvae]MCB8875883.1 phosphoglycerate dehydrogenase [Acidisoma silvae]